MRVYLVTVLICGLVLVLTTGKGSAADSKTTTTTTAPEAVDDADAEGEPETEPEVEPEVENEPKEAPKVTTTKPSGGADTMVITYSTVIGSLLLTKYLLGFTI